MDCSQNEGQSPVSDCAASATDLHRVSAEQSSMTAFWRQ